MWSDIAAALALIFLFVKNTLMNFRHRFLLSHYKHMYEAIDFYLAAMKSLER